MKDQVPLTVVLFNLVHIFTTLSPNPHPNSHGHSGLRKSVCLLDKETDSWGYFAHQITLKVWEGQTQTFPKSASIERRTPPEPKWSQKCNSLGWSLWDIHFLCCPVECKHVCVWHVRAPTCNCLALLRKRVDTLKRRSAFGSTRTSYKTQAPSRLHLSLDT